MIEGPWVRVHRFRRLLRPWAPRICGLQMNCPVQQTFPRIALCIFFCMCPSFFCIFSFIFFSIFIKIFFSVFRIQFPSSILVSPDRKHMYLKQFLSDFLIPPLCVVPWLQTSPFFFSAGHNVGYEVPDRRSPPPMSTANPSCWASSVCLDLAPPPASDHGKAKATKKGTVGKDRAR